MLNKLIIYILAIPLLLALVSSIIRSNRVSGWLNSLGYAIAFSFSLILMNQINNLKDFTFANQFFYVDSLSALFIFIITLVNLATSFYSCGYLKDQLSSGQININKFRLYNVLSNLFSFTMYLVIVINNIGLIWVSIEMTTLISAFLVGFYANKESLEAAWKYIIICSVGIIIALLGTILFAYALAQAGVDKSFSWTNILSWAQSLDKNIIKIAFIFIIVGYGTKVGFAPMHTWLPDAYSQTIAPMSALISSVLSKTALYAILRFSLIVNANLGSQTYTSNLFIFFGLCSLAIAVVFVLVQRDLKRLLAYSSIEHIGLIALGFGISGPLALTGALLHIINHACSKAFMFFNAGNIVSHYKRNNMNSIHGVLETIPFTGVMIILGMFALTGLPPFSIFFSELIIVIAGFSRGYFLITIGLLLALSIIFCGIIFNLNKIIFGHKPKDIELKQENFSIKLALLVLLVPMLLLGLWLPPLLADNINAIIKIMIR